MREFEEIELRIIEEFLIKRIIYIRESNLMQELDDGLMLKKGESFSLVFNVELFDKIKSGVRSGYSSKELSIFNSCVNENLPYLEKQVFFDNSTRWFSLTEEEVEVMLQIDTCMRILTKTGYHKKYGWEGRDPDFSFGSILETLRKILNSSKILMHTSGDKVYKVALIFEDKEILKFKPESRMVVADLAFAPLPEITPEEYAIGRYSIIVNRSEAVTILETSPVHYFDDNVRELVFAMLE